MARLRVDPERGRAASHPPAVHPPGAGRPEAADPRRWLILAVVTLAAFITNVDATIVIIGLPRLVEGLHTTVTTGLWTLTAYIITSTVLLLPAGRWSDLAGRRRIFVAGMVVFTIATTLCGVATSGAGLVGFRLLQGAGGALALATATPLLVDAFPRSELGRALGINSTAWVLGSIVGPVAGGALVSGLGWRWIFFVTVPFGLAGALLGLVVLPRRSAPARTVPTDWAGAASFGLGLTALLIALSEGLGWGWASWRIVSLLAGTLVLFAGFALWELRAGAALFDLRLLRHPHYRDGLGVVAGYSIGFFATTFLLTFYLQGAMHLSPLDAGLLLIPLSAPQLVLGPLGGHLADRLGPARPVLAGLCLLVVSALLLGLLGPHLSIGAVVLPLLVMSVANGLAWPSLTKVVMASAPPERTGVASGMFYTLRNVGMSLSLTLALVVAEASLPPTVAVKVFLGTSPALTGHLGAALVRSTDAGFRVFVGFYAAALLVALALLRPVRAGRGAPSATVPGTAERDARSPRPAGGEAARAGTPEG